MFHQEKYDIHFIATLEEGKDGYIVVPPTTAKGMPMADERYAIDKGDFKEDPLFNELFKNRTIEKYAIVSFKTLSSSKIWAQENEVSSYRDLILKEITDDDRWRGYAWILDGRRLYFEKC